MPLATRTPGMNQQSLAVCEVVQQMTTELPAHPKQESPKPVSESPAQHDGRQLGMKTISPCNQTVTVLFSIAKAVRSS
jgi:hypothetical protein